VKVAEHILRKQFEILTNALGKSAVFKLLAGECPENCEDPDPEGPVLVHIDLSPHPFVKKDGQLRLTETLLGKGAAAAGRGRTAKSYRIYNAAGEVITQGSVTAPDDGGDLTMDNCSISKEQNVVIGTFELTMREYPKPPAEAA
jgi:hypothetical protein